MDDATRDRILHFIGDSIAPPPASNTRRVIRGPHSLPNKATAVIGMRRAGKTTFLHQMRSERIAAGIAAAQLPYWNFEDERISGLRAEQLHLLLSEYFRQHPDLRQRQTVTLCLDEIQVVPGWERFVRRLLDTEKVEIFLSGSSAAMLSREVATSMRGRGWEVVVHPFSFAEALAHQGDAALLAATAPTSRRRSLLEKRLIDYLAIGGFPEVQDVDDATRNRILLDYVDVVMLRDVVERHEITGITALRWLVRHLLGNAGGSFSVQKFFDALKSQGLRLAKDSLHDLVAHLNDCFLVRTVWLETESERRRMVNPRKIYPVDPAFIRRFDPARRANVGHTLEAAVLIELERRGAAVTYVRTEAGHEVDFLARFPDGAVQLIQVAAAAVHERTVEREVRALAEAKPSFPGCTAHLVVLDHDGLPPSLPRGITAHAATEWMLGGD